VIRRICILTPEVVLLKWDIDKPYGVGLLVGARFLRIIVMFTTLELFRLASVVTVEVPLGNLMLQVSPSKVKSAVAFVLCCCYVCCPHDNMEKQSYLVI
jgi:hypothetical protein